ncbi:MAG: Asp-tRNA(Asn)/Glu-tRNA(Gln) amidotransferase subunit GatA, partial [Gallicola sp.]|nr:Asp-tRNA(Asn)/Glu-tRNA(Gln) amidotransferase subunit GatA [Gallicola sp.]
METSLLREKLIHKEIDIDEYYSELFKKIEETKDLNIFITFDKDFVLEQINVLKEKLEKNETPGRLFGIPITIKDNILTEGLRTTCASKALEDYMPVYNATVIERLKSEDAVIIGKTNMDEFAMGGASETSYFGPTKNPLDPKLIPGGSSSGSAASVSTGLVNISLGSDTGGSIRQPSAFCNVTGFLPSYGSVSRYGVASMANTLDQVGVVGKSVEDIVTTLNIIGGHDSKDMTSSQKESLDLQLKEEYTLKGKKIGVIDTEAFPIHKTVVEDYNT